MSQGVNRKFGASRFAPSLSAATMALVRRVTTGHQPQPPPAWGFTQTADFCYNRRCNPMYATGRPNVNSFGTAICGRNSVVECQLPKLDVRGSNPLARS